MNRLAVLAHPRFCEDLARLIVEMMVPDHAVDVFHDQIKGALMLRPQRHEWIFFFDTFPEAVEFTREVSRLYNDVMRAPSFLVKDLEPGFQCTAMFRT